MATPITLGTLPLAVRVALRDQYESPNSSIQKSLSSLNGVIGWTLSLEIAWVDLWNSLSSKYSEDKGSFVGTITEAVRNWLSRLEQLLEGDEEFAEKFLETMERARKALFVQIHDLPDPKTTMVQHERLTLLLPNATASEYRNINSKIGGDIEAAFKGDGKDEFVEISPAAEDLSAHAAPATHGSSTTSNVPKSKVTRLPTLASLSRPETLFRDLVPYTLIVRRSSGGIEIEGSHEPTLELIAEYFKRHSRKNLNDTRQIPYFNVELVPSFYGSGTFHDRVKIEKEDNRAHWVSAEISPVVVFVEAVCGYNLWKYESGEWVFRREEPFQR